MKTAFIFPGQGSQLVGMGKGFAEALLDQANEVLGIDLKRICFEGSQEELKKTEISQPAILTVSIAAFDILKSKNIKPDYVAGHSLGEYSALVAAESINFKDAVRLVYLRGKFMQEAVPIGQGAMAAILMLDKEQIKECCDKAKDKGVVQIANFNAPGQIVISGEREAVLAASAFCKEAGAKRIIPLAVSAPFHSILMQKAADKLKIELDKINIKDANVPLVSNIDAEPVTSALKIKENLYSQVVGSVLWEDSVKKMVSLGVEKFIEVGPGNVLCGLVKKIDPTLVRVQNFESVLLEGFGR